MAEFQIIPKYIIGKEIIENLIHQLRINNIKKFYLILQDIGENNAYLSRFETLCKQYGIVFHKEIVNFEILDKDKFNYYLTCLKNGLPECFVVFGSELAINVAKLLNFLISKYTKSITNLEEFINNLDKMNEYPLKIYCVINGFTLGSENNFAGILEIENNGSKKYVFNANSMPSVIYSSTDFFEEIEIKSIQLNIFGMYTRLIEQFLGTNNFEWTKNYIVANMQTILDVVEFFNGNLKTKQALENIIWTNFCINNGISNLLSIGDWKMHAFAYELVEAYKINLNTALLTIIIPYLQARQEIDYQFKIICLDFIKRLYGTNELGIWYEKINELQKKLNLYNDMLVCRNELLRDIEKLNLAKERTIKKIISNEQRTSDEDLNKLFDLLIKKL